MTHLPTDDSLKPWGAIKAVKDDFERPVPGVSDPADPIYIWSPAARCGTTLLQRLITESGQAFIYGEWTIFSRNIPKYAAAVKERKHNDYERFKTDRQFWSAAVHPNKEALVAALKAGLKLLAQAYAASSPTYRWGIKNPTFDLWAYQVIKEVFPNSKHLFIYRNLTDVVKSYKARMWLKQPYDVVKVADLYYQGMREGHQEGICQVKYEALVKEPVDMCKKIFAYLELFPGDWDFVPRIMAKKVNTFQDPERDRGFAPDEYAPPVKLTPVEIKMLEGVGREPDRSS